MYEICSTAYVVHDIMLQAIYAARETSSSTSISGNSKGAAFIPLRSPATSERIRMACGDKFTEKYVDNESNDTYQPKMSC